MEIKREPVKYLWIAEHVVNIYAWPKTNFW